MPWYLILILIILGIIYWIPKFMLSFLNDKDEWTHYFLPDTIRTPSSFFGSYRHGSRPILLTIDDVPCSRDSFKKILDILRCYHQNAVFFVISSLVNDTNYDLLVRAVKEGHLLANHGVYDHYHCLRSSDKVDWEMYTCQEMIKRIYYDAGILYPKVNLFRPGGGIMNKTIISNCQKHKLTPLLGSVYPHDPHIRFPNINLWYIQQHLNGNDILILHDRSWTPELLIQIFEWFDTYGFHTLEISDLQSSFEELEEYQPEKEQTWTTQQNQYQRQNPYPPYRNLYPSHEIY